MTRDTGADGDEGAAYRCTNPKCPAQLSRNIAHFVSKAAIAASPAVDTPKIVNSSRIIKEKAPEREKLWLAQTPQVFERTLYRVAAYYAKEEDFEATDDASLLEFAGFTVKAVDTETPNFKVTHPTDIIIASAIIESRNKSDKEKAI